MAYTNFVIEVKVMARTGHRRTPPISCRLGSVRHMFRDGNQRCNPTEARSIRLVHLDQDQVK